MTSIHSLYGLFELSPNCSDSELRQAFRNSMLRYHPDRNPDNVESATNKTQELTCAYDLLKKYREDGGQALGPEIEFSETGPEFTFTVSFFSSGVDLEDISRRKKSFHEAWKIFQENPRDVINALLLVHAAINAGREDSVADLLQNPILIDSSAILLDKLDPDIAQKTLLRWADALYSTHPLFSIQILEDAHASGKVSNDIAEQLRSFHYSYAQGYATESKPNPSVRLGHFRRIIELGFELDYIYKLIAEAYYELGEEVEAKKLLAHAYKLNPELSGAIRISRALGFLPPKKKRSSQGKRNAKYDFSKLEQIPQPSIIRNWALSGNWDEILRYANVNNYSPRIVPKSRSTLRQIAESLGDLDDRRAREVLTNFLDSVYWDVRRASMVSLSKIGDQQILGTLLNYHPKNSTDQSNLKNAVSYLKARLRSTSAILGYGKVNDVLQKAKLSYDKGDYGQARLLLEAIAETVQRDSDLYIEVVVLLAESCAEMEDTDTAISLVMPILDRIPTMTRSDLLSELTSWIWNSFVFDPYEADNDQYYFQAVNIHLYLALSSNDPDTVLGNLRSLTRWFEILGDGLTAQYIRHHIRTEAPGTWYVDKHDREQYIREVEMSEELQLKMNHLKEEIHAKVHVKLIEVLRGSGAIHSHDKSLLDSP